MSSKMPMFTHTGVNFNHFFDKLRSRDYYCAPMPGQLPELVDPVALATRGAKGSRRYKLHNMGRLMEHLAGDDAEVEASFVFEMRGRLPMVSGKVTGELPLECQRCMQVYKLPVDHEFRLGVISSEAEEEILPDGVEPLLPAENRIRLADLVEDELILLVPIVPSHEEGQCEVTYSPKESEEDAQEARENPFAVLKKQ